MKAFRSCPEVYVVLEYVDRRLEHVRAVLDNLDAAKELVDYMAEERDRSNFWGNKHVYKFVIRPTPTDSLLSYLKGVNL